jgi:DNA-binding transcriptional LysR family regulator
LIDVARKLCSTSIAGILQNQRDQELEDRTAAVLADIQLSYFIIFEAVARLKSARKAARELGLTDAGVSYSLSRLEKKLGVALFLLRASGRRSRPVTPSPAGTILLKNSRQALAALQRGLDGIVHAQDRPRRRPLAAHDLEHHGSHSGERLAAEDSGDLLSEEQR